MDQSRRKLVIEEVARIALEDPRIRDYIGHELNLSDKILKETYRYLEGKLKNQ